MTVNRRTLGMVLFGTALAMCSLVVNPGPTAAVEVGEPAPGFTLPSTTGAGISLSDFKGKKFVFLEFYAADGSTGWYFTDFGRHGAESSRATRSRQFGSRPIPSHDSSVMKSVVIGLVVLGIFLERRQPAGPVLLTLGTWQIRGDHGA